MLPITNDPYRKSDIMTYLSERDQNACLAVCKNWNGRINFDFIHSYREIANTTKKVKALRERMRESGIENATPQEKLDFIRDEMWYYLTQTPGYDVLLEKLNIPRIAKQITKSEYKKIMQFVRENEPSRQADYKRRIVDSSGNAFFEEDVRYSNAMNNFNDNDHRILRVSNQIVGIFSFTKGLGFNVVKSLLATSTLHPAVAKFKDAHMLEISNSDLFRLPASMSKLTNLIFLNLGHNQFSKVPEVISKLPNLKMLDLNGNNLTRLPTSLFLEIQLAALTVRFNPLKGRLPIEAMNQSKLMAFESNRTHINMVLDKYISEGNVETTTPLAAFKELGRIYIKGNGMYHLPTYAKLGFIVISHFVKERWTGR